MNYLSLADWILKATLTGSILVVMVMVMLIKRVFTKKLNVATHYYLWILLILKLIVPSGPESKISLYNVIYPAYSYNSYGSTYEDTTKVPKNPVYENKENDNNLEINSTDIKESVPSETISIVHSKINYKKVFFLIWIVGAALASVHTISDVIRIKKITLSSKRYNE